MVSKPTHPLDYPILKFIWSAPALDYAIIKFKRPWTRQWRHRIRLSPEHAGIKIVTLRRKMAEWWRFDDFSNIPIFMNYDKLNINYELILSKISKKRSQKTHPPHWLLNFKFHIIGPSPWLSDNKIMAPTHTTMAL